MQKKTKVIRLIVELLIIAVLLVVLVNVYKNNNFNKFIRAEGTLGLSKFSRDGNVKNSSMYSYKIENTDYTDAMFYKKIKVNPNTSYRITCMVKTENVINKEIEKDGGAHISINGTIEKSNCISGTQDWTKLEFLFNSKNRNELEVGFRLGGYETDSLGTAWFSDMTIESGLAQNDSNWNFLCLIFKSTDVDLNIGNKIENIKIELTQSDIDDMKMSFNRLSNSLYEMSDGKMNATGVTVELNDPIKSMSYSEENGYYVSPIDVADILDKYIDEGIYDHIFIVFKTGNMNKNVEIPTNDWIGLGSMEYRNIGFSNIRVPSDEDSYIYKYDSRINTFPEEVYMHEFLHTIEKNAEDYGYDRPELHDYEKYGYKNKAVIGLKEWYQDYISCNINANGKKIGIPEEVLSKKPTKTTDFEYTHKLNDFKEPENIIEEIRAFAYKITKTVESLTNKK